MKRSSEPRMARCSMTGTLRVVVGGHVFGPEAARHREIDLHGAALPGTADGVLDVELDLRAVEGALARQFGPLQSGSAQTPAQRILGLVPDLVGPDPAFRTQRQLDGDIMEAEIGIDLFDQRIECRHFGFDLVFGTEDVAVVLDEAAHAHQPCSAPAGSLRWQEPNSP
jgi:hypothetical protein